MKIKRNYKNFSEAMFKVCNNKLDLDREDHLGDLEFLFKGTDRFVMNVIVKPTDQTPDGNDIQQIFCETYLLREDEGNPLYVGSTIIGKSKNMTEISFWNCAVDVMRGQIMNYLVQIEKVQLSEEYNSISLSMRNPRISNMFFPSEMVLTMDVPENIFIDDYVGIRSYDKFGNIAYHENAFLVRYEARLSISDKVQDEDENINCEIYAIVQIIDPTSLYEEFPKSVADRVIRISQMENGQKVDFLDENQLTINELFESYWKVLTNTF